MSHFTVSRFAAQLMLDTESLIAFSNPDVEVFPKRPDAPEEYDMGSIQQRFGRLTEDEVVMLDTRDFTAIANFLATAPPIKPIHDDQVGDG